MEELSGSTNFKGPTFLYSSTEELDSAQRVRIFAGPNGSGKSTVIGSVRQFIANGRPIDFGHYINADDIAQELYQSFFFDNSVDGQPSNMFAHFKVIDGKKVWDIPDADRVPIWFKRFYRKDSLDYFKTSTTD